MGKGEIKEIQSFRVVAQDVAWELLHPVDFSMLILPANHMDKGGLP